MDELRQEDTEGVSFEVRQEQAITLVKLAGELDLGNSDGLEGSLQGQIASVRERLVLDLTELRFADSSGIALWVRWRNAVPAFEIRNPPALVRRVIESMGLTQALGVK